jgi:hypothetical protein
MTSAMDSSIVNCFERNVKPNLLFFSFLGKKPPPAPSTGGELWIFPSGGGVPLSGGVVPPQFQTNSKYALRNL